MSQAKKPVQVAKTVNVNDVRAVLQKQKEERVKEVAGAINKMVMANAAVGLTKVAVETKDLEAAGVAPENVKAVVEASGFNAEIDGKYLVVKMPE